MNSEVRVPENRSDSAQTKTNAQTDGNAIGEREEFANQIREKVVVSGWALLGTLAVGLFFVYCSYVPLYHTDLWGHVGYGKWMLEHGALPIEDPFVSLAGGVEVIDNAWLSQLAFGWVVQNVGVAGLSDLYAVSCLAFFLALVAAFSWRAKNWGVGFFCAVGAWGMIAFRLAIMRPELLGGLCFALLLAQVALMDRRRANTDESKSGTPLWAWFTIPLTFTLWTNLHGSYIVGFALVGSAVLGSAVEALVRTQSILGTWRDQRFRADLIILQLSLLAACLNPYGIDLLLQTVLFPSHPNLKSVMEWFPLEFMSLEGIPMAISWVVAAFAIRHSRVKFSVRDVFLLLLLSLAVCMRVRMIAWYSPIYFFVMAPHFADSLRQLGEVNFIERLTSSLAFLSRPSFHVALVTGLICYLAFAFSPVSRHVMGGNSPPEEKLYSYQTPVKLSKYFQEHPPGGLIYAPQWWGDWLIWQSDEELEVFVSTNTIHLVPETVWQHYLTMSRGRVGFDRLLNRYRINTIVVSKDLQPGLEKMMKEKLGWKSVYEDEISVVFERESVSRSASQADSEVAVH
ncbi:hypothetical protein [Thalassoglobus polymorphus]|uniref:Glycosyltransferase RgtA/B/C/D-like domain-containing protein n=1 Tax=Thalassoglobus polymorphus TaxID=2527994 RepID=A0A517QPJ7_9PLAN|nr:hypothetical protein [Thalassoglobus polymorphus]QDT33556.1 hypothetical protein Mal48_28090 [Thalassoglobus polymorphus]